MRWGLFKENHLLSWLCLIVLWVGGILDDIIRTCLAKRANRFHWISFCCFNMLSVLLHDYSPFTWLTFHSRIITPTVGSFPQIIVACGAAQWTFPLGRIIRIKGLSVIYEEKAEPIIIDKTGQANQPTSRQEREGTHTAKKATKATSTKRRRLSLSLPLKHTKRRRFSCLILVRYLHW